MVAFNSTDPSQHGFGRPRLTRALPLYGAVAGGLLTAGCIALLSTTVLDTLVWTTGIAALVPAAAPPLAMTTRILLALGGGALVGGLLWSSLFLLFGPGGIFAGRVSRDDGVPVVRRADAHPDAPPRKPMSAADLGTPMMEVGVGAARDDRPIPANLDLPLAAFDPTAILPVPMAPVRPVAPLAQPTILAPVIEMSSTAEAQTFVTAPSPKPIDPRVDVLPDEADEQGWGTSQSIEDDTPPTPIERSTPPSPDQITLPTIEALLQRLENGALRRGSTGSH